MTNYDETIRNLSDNERYKVEVSLANTEVSQADLNKLVKDFTQGLTDRYNNQIAGNTNLNEIIDARTDSDSKTFPTLKGRLDNIEGRMQVKNVKEINFLDYGFIPDDQSAESKNNSLWNRLMLETVDLKIEIPTNYRFWMGNCAVTRGNFELYGGGTFTGMLTCDEGYSKNEIHIKNVKFVFDSLSDGNNAITLSEATRGSIRQCYFKNCDKAIQYKSVDHAQHVSRFVIDGNYMLGVKYALYGLRPETFKQPLIAADLHFTNNIVEECYITHVHVEGYDGGIIGNNTFFFPSYMRRPGDKLHNIYIKYCDWTIISGNNLFEAGSDAICIEHGQHLSITGNNIAWPGQRIGGSGIKFTNYDNAGGSFNISTVTGNNIMFPTESGIYLGQGIGYVTVEGNTIFSAGNTTYYYGESSRLDSLERWGIYLAPSTQKNLILGNSMEANALNNLNDTNLIKHNLTANTSGTTAEVAHKVLSVTVAANEKIATAGSGLNQDKILGVSLIYNDSVYNNIATAVINEDGSISVVCATLSTCSFTYKVRIAYLM